MEGSVQVSKCGKSLAVRLPKALVEERRAAFLAAMAPFRWTAPPDYRFDRDDAYRDL